MVLMGGCGADGSMPILSAAAATSSTSSADAVALKNYVKTAVLYLRADRSGEIINIYKVPVPDCDWEVVPVYFSRAAYDAELGALGPPLVLRGDELLRLTRGLGIAFNLGRDPELIWAGDYADDVRSEWADFAIPGS